MSDTTRSKLGIVVGGGPAPGINGVISSVTIEAINQELEVIGIRDGFKNLVNGDISHIRQLTIPDVAPFYQKGGSMLGTSRTNPAKDPKHMENVLEGLKKLGIKYLVTIGGDDTAFSASQVYANANKTIKVAHVPKTIDNDLPLPAGIPTFGFETARHYGVQIARNLHEDAKTTTRWYLCISMGRAAGHLALGIGKASAATITIIAEEFEKREVSLELICDILIGSMIKRKAAPSKLYGVPVPGKDYGLAVLSEGLLERIGEERLKEIMAANPGEFGTIELDGFGHLRLGEIEFGRMVRTFLKRRLATLGLKFDMVDKDLGYELRCADPIPFDVEYTRNLGYGAVKFLLSSDAEKNGVVITFVGGSMVPKPFQDMIDPETKKMRPRLVEVKGENYAVARRYMIRLEKADFEDSHHLEKLAAVVKMTSAQFTDRFAYVLK